MQKTLTVHELNKYLKARIAADPLLSGLYVRGEISNFKHHYSGHLYFTLKDEKSLIRCVMFRSNAQKLKFAPKDGMKVILKGYVSVFERDGQYQLYALEMEPDGLGALHMAFEQLKEKLKKEGLFDQSRKKKLPYIPQLIGVVTSPKGAVIRDIVNVVSRRFYNIKIQVYPVQVQGPQAAAEVAEAINKLNDRGEVDVIIVARGGGSLEDLWAFNEEIVARSIYQSRIPVISAIGHETDFTIADFVADLRAPTPSAAAELVIPNKKILKENIKNLSDRLQNSIERRISNERPILKRLTQSPAFTQPYTKLYQERIRVDVQAKYLLNAIDHVKKNNRNKLAVLAAGLNSLSPLDSLSRGYSIVKSYKDNAIVKSIEGISEGDELQINVKDGYIDCIVNNTGRRPE